LASNANISVLSFDLGEEAAVAAAAKHVLPYLHSVYITFGADTSTRTPRSSAATFWYSATAVTPSLLLLLLMLMPPPVPAPAMFPS
jgi:hypothetical protein